MSSTRKKAIIRKLSRDWLAGYLSSTGFVHGGRAEVLDLSGKVLELPVQELKWICFVRDFNSGEVQNPERLLRKTYAIRPRGEGLWLRLQFKDGDSIEGHAENNLGLLDPEGFFLTPPDIRGNTQRIWIPRVALQEMEVVAVIGAAKKKAAAALEPEQESLFPLTKN